MAKEMRVSPERHRACNREAAPTPWLGCTCTIRTLSKPAGKAYLLHGIDTDTCPIDLDFVCVHCCVGHQDLCILYPLGLPHSNLLIQDEALIQKGILKNRSSSQHIKNWPPYFLSVIFLMPDCSHQHLHSDMP